MIADRAFMSEILNVLEHILWELETPDGPASTLAACLSVKSHYDNAIAFVGLFERNPERVVHELDRQFERCDPRYMFVYDHIKECVKRGLVITYGEYAEMARKFPRCR